MSGYASIVAALLIREPAGMDRRPIHTVDRPSQQAEEHGLLGPVMRGMRVHVSS